MNDSQNSFYTRKEKLDKLETEYYRLQDWFGKYDRLIWTLRSLLFTIYAGTIIYSFRVKTPSSSLASIIVLFSFFFLSMEIFWLYMYHSIRTRRYKDIQNLINFPSPKLIDKAVLVDMDMNHSGRKRADINLKLIEPTLFYFILAILSCIIIFT